MRYETARELIAEALETIDEGAVKNMMFDYVEGLPKKAVHEIKSKHGDELASGNLSSSCRKSIHGILKQHGVKPLMGSHRHGVEAVGMMFHGIHGDINEAVAMGDPNRGGEGRKKPLVPPGIDPYGTKSPSTGKPVKTLGKTHKRLSTLGSKDKTRYYQNIGMRSRAASKGGKTGRLYPLPEETDPTVASVAEAILAGDSARRSMLIQRKREADRVLRDRADALRSGYAPSPQKSITDVPLTVDPKKKLKPRQTDRRGIVAVKKPDFDTPEEAIRQNQIVARDIISTIGTKPHGTPVNIYGRKKGQGADSNEHKVRVSKTRIMGRDVHVVHGTDREVHLNASGAGLQVIDAKTKRIILDKGNDADW